MERTLILDCNNKVGQEIRVCGWVQTRRDHGKIAFLDLMDRSGIIQVFCRGEDVKEIHPQDVICITGLVNSRPENLINSNLATGKIELHAKQIEVLVKAAELPFDMGGKDLDLQLPTLLDHRPLTLRHPKVKAIFKVQEVVIDAFRKALTEKDFIEFQAPTIVPAATEGGAEIFPVDYYQYKAYLGQSPQLYKQIMVGVFERVFTVGRAYRAEPSVTTRHLSEYISLDCEFGFIESWSEVPDLAEDVIKRIFSEVEKRCGRELELYGVGVPQIAGKLPRIKLTEAQQIIKTRTGREVIGEPDLSPEDEREITEWAKEKHGSELIIITHYPTSKRPFYTYPDPEDPEHTLSFDLIGRGVEWFTGGQRINDHQQLLESMKKKGVNPENFQLYLQAFQYGLPPEGGFAIGAERVTMHILGLSNIREASLFPRDMERVDVRLSTIKK
ncbi:aspartate--tRNA(Asn) ligase [Candidatus Daviesbacteria bacterium RIFCSPLOWO2_02_FULL_40_8]|uniref:Aspartate--tRNA ligase n=1 Tax=Candidatus Daviesbacteria bacterium RIFCSPLOWO2_01_FULL_40_24 TaxID=1797787 RepID=A0A1F5MIJ9_9BACT|nr:MAG: aspartate--tRNA(Asn) ligase [Candidatus Daviesbacteria bacterium RIFCSPHIGHO2_01_FULL_41_45]OGE34201.1 MAG: aspartate--tRNA(Asn) ligase [Candidatus Daviesbacteria bacterium RIFCSPHIGHO2_02_FULL_41_14]OGE65185.1 MAG: aspartate--tRNA(Asn) ligase [Candidatus Daviesbacteria bacterium RIFCSPLOWO2_01_FULL_40_24]OGE66888.1 MAG: aspartate--tRNA(Asn) ligase [Candidatus Daviesbacteria bacterium RIFCSPLOWO2_02_FULL_40_8]